MSDCETNPHPWFCDDHGKWLSCLEACPECIAQFRSAVKSVECDTCGLHHPPTDLISTANGEFDIPDGLNDLGYSYVECQHCQARIWGTPDNIDSGYRKHLDNYCSMRPREEP